MGDKTISDRETLDSPVEWVYSPYLCLIRLTTDCVGFGRGGEVRRDEEEEWENDD